MPVQLTLYVREGCALCDDMERALQAYRTNLGFETRRVIINGDADLETRFGEFVPLLSYGEEEICHYFLDPQALKKACAA